MGDKWHRQYVGNPHSQEDGPTILICLTGNTIVGHLGTMPVELSMGDSLARAVWLTDFYVLPEFRKKMVGLLLLRHAMQTQEIILTLGTTDQMSKLLRGIGWNDLGSLRSFKRLINAEALISRLTKLPLVPRLVGWPLQGVIHCLCDLPYRRIRVQVHQAKQPDSQVDQLWKSVAPRSETSVEFIGLDPAANMRTRAMERTRDHSNVSILEGSFEQMPIDSESVDYLYSILAFHWTTDVGQSVDEIVRVLKPGGEMDLIFIGRHNGREFIRGTTPVFLKYMGPALLLESANMRKQLSKDEALEFFGNRFHPCQLTIEESYETYYDTLEGHWAWWVRIEAHFLKIPSHRKEQCDREVKKVISSLKTDKGIPYTIHLLHVRLRCA